MPFEICTIGGFSRTEGNSVAIKVDNEVIILDMGLSMENYINYTEDREDISARTYKQLLQVNAVPNYHFIDDWKEQVIAIIPSHGHLDHVGAVPFAASLFPDAPVIGTPYTIEVLKSLLWDDGIEIPNELIPLSSNSSYKISNNITVELVHVTHSIPHTALVILHTPYGKIMYANDYKFDPTPVLGKKPNFERIIQLGKEGINVLILNCLYAHEHKKTPSESVAKEMLKDVMLGINTEGKGLIVTTFSSHIARLKSIIELGKKLNREVVLIGRSLNKYVTAAQRIDLVNFEKDVTLLRHRDKIERMLHRIQREGKGKYLLVCTGHQGEPKSILTRMIRGELEYKFAEGDTVIFSCAVIPVETNIKNREKMEKALRGMNVRIFRDVHVSGHGALEDHRDMLQMVKPKHIIPIHAEPAKGKMLADFAYQLGFKNTHVMEDGKRMVIPAFGG